MTTTAATRAATRLVLVHSGLPLANGALKAGAAARVAARRAEDLAAELDRREAKPLPERGRERRWAFLNLASFRKDAATAYLQADILTEQWVRLQDQLDTADPVRAAAVDLTVWSAL